MKVRDLKDRSRSNNLQLDGLHIASTRRRQAVKRSQNYKAYQGKIKKLRMFRLSELKESVKKKEVALRRKEQLY